MIEHADEVNEFSMYVQRCPWRVLGFLEVALFGIGLGGH
jgi:hypothetical protein